MTLVRAGLLNAIAVLIKILTLLGVNKLLAMYVGPGGYAVLGQFQNAIQIITTFATGTINLGVTKLTAEYVDDEAKQRSVWSTAAFIVLSGSVIATLFILVFNEQLAFFFLKDRSYGGVFVCFGISLVFLTANTLLLAILVGKKEVSRYVLASISGSLLSLLVTSVMSVKFGLYGALVALAIYQSLSFFATLLLCCKESWFKVSYFFCGFNKSIAANLSKYVLMALTTTICAPVSYMFVRDFIGNEFGWQAAGCWEAILRLSSASLMLVSTTLGIYYLPKITQLKKVSDIKKELFHVYRIVLPVAVLGSFVIYVLRDYIVLILFTKDFYPMRDLFFWQMFGDVLRVGGWMFTYIMQGKGMVKLYVLSEVVFSASFVVLAWLLMKVFDVQGVVIAHSINYLFYWVVMGFLVWRRVCRTAI
ncbi:O-antigen translocase [Pseudomonas saponiphila]|uniref:Polysaccharide transporter, PST family n=1 Tax=Pseudomonas saponiphila TaxID=556534 RepID=A0A1H4L2W4_9PSED|nr:O-antigen translocase [Pseudomonas saponiphila]SEB65071.1 polysaccharide transporter, PST family [Pseudomonas saponiphila]